MTSDTQVAQLQQRVAELERQVAELTHSVDMYQRVIDALPQTIFWKDTRLIYRGCNLSFAAFAGYDSPAGVIGKSDLELPWKPEETESYQADDRAVMTSGESRLHFVQSQRQASGQEIWVETSKAPLRDASGAIIGVVGCYEDITERVLAQEAEIQRQRELIATQQATLAELSTPLIPLTDNVVLMPLIGTIDSRRAQQIMETLLEGIARYQADIALLDISGVRVVDTQVADALLRTARAARLLGTQVVLTGISPEIAQTIVHLGAEMSNVSTQATLQQALQVVMIEQRAVMPA